MPFTRDSITEQVYELLQREIGRGAIAPGARIFEDRLAKKLGISKTPLRLALHRLKQDGIVRIEARRGIYLAVPTLAEALELVEMREALEGMAARRAAARMTPQLVSKMQACFAGFDDGNLAERSLRYSAADHKFHRLLVQASGSKELIRILEIVNLRLHMNRLQRTLTRDRDLRRIHSEHLEIIKALKAGDSRAAESLVRAHVRNIPWETVLHEPGIAAGDAGHATRSAA